MFLRFMAAISSFSGCWAACGCSAPWIDAQVAELRAAERPTRQHALHGLLDDALGELALEDRAGRALLDAADEAGVVVIDLLLALAAGQHDLVGVDDDDIVAVVDVRGVGRLVLAAQAHGDDRGEAADDQAVGVDQHPFLLDVGGLGRIELTWDSGPWNAAFPSVARLVAEASRTRQCQYRDNIYDQINSL